MFHIHVPGIYIPPVPGIKYLAVLRYLILAGTAAAVPNLSMQYRHFWRGIVPNEFFVCRYRIFPTLLMLYLAHRVVRAV